MIIWILNKVWSGTMHFNRAKRRIISTLLCCCGVLLWGLLQPPMHADVLDPPTYKALIIGINDYADNSSTGWQDLKAAEKDTDALYQLLTTKYGFGKDQVTHLSGRKASRVNILDALDTILGQATKRDSVLIYFAGHGAVRTGNYYWIPSDGNQQIHLTGVPTASIAQQVNASRARHVLLIADSCFAGYMGLSRGKEVPKPLPPAEPPDYETWLRSDARQVLVSGDRTTVFDEAISRYTGERVYNGHSPFAAKLLGRLEANLFTWLAVHEIQTGIAGELMTETGQWANLRSIKAEASGMFVFHNRMASSSRVDPTIGGIWRAERAGETGTGFLIQKETRVMVTSDIGGALYLDGKLQSEKSGPQAVWEIATGPGSLQVELRGDCQTLSRTIKIQEEQEGKVLQVSLDGTPGTACTRLPKSRGNTSQEVIYWQSLPGTGPKGFKMGSPDSEGDSDEHPQRTVTIQPFLMSKTEVTVAQYRACVMANWKGCTEEGLTEYDTCNWNKPARDNHPINCVDWDQAKAFAAWVAVSTPGVRLPSSSEWEYAARGLGGRKYPWGNTPEPSCDLAVMVSCPGETQPVCSKTSGHTPTGLCDMAGNVWEWVAGCHETTYLRAPDNDTPHTICFASSPIQNAVYRTLRSIALSDFNVGFRVVRVPPSKDP